MFGEAVEARSAAASVPTEHTAMQQRACEAAMTVALPVMTRALREMAERALAAQAEWQQTLVQRLDTTMLEIRRTFASPPAANATSPRQSEELEIIDVDASESKSDACLRSKPVPLKKFLRERWQADWLRAGVRHTCCALQFAVLLQARGVGGNCGVRGARGVPAGRVRESRRDERTKRAWDRNDERNDRLLEAQTVKC